MRAAGRPLLYALLFAVALGLILVLFRTAGITLGDIGATLLGLPMWLLAAVLGLTFINLAISVVRWRLVALALDPDAKPMRFGQGLTATLWGAMYGQILPVQLSMPLARWSSLRASAAVKSTLYEQMFDFLLLGASAVVALVLFASGIPMGWAMAGFLAAIGMTGLAMRTLLGAATHAVMLAARWFAPMQKIRSKLIRPIVRARDLPKPLMTKMASLSALRLAVLTLRTVLIVLVVAPVAEVGLVAIGYPLVGLAFGAPFLPAGLGIADWSLTAIVVFAGAATAAAAKAAITLRVLNFAAIGALLLAMVSMGSVRTNSKRQSPQGALTH